MKKSMGRDTTAKTAKQMTTLNANLTKTEDDFQKTIDVLMQSHRTVSFEQTAGGYLCWLNDTQIGRGPSAWEAYRAAKEFKPWEDSRE